MARYLASESDRLVERSLKDNEKMVFFNHGTIIDRKKDERLIADLMSDDR